ncbi:MAG: DEAD/DEAH box helicase [Methanolinea sp.]|jgi:superfamily II DNA or RNA helicase|nr:DEAD/DEAH box helicase [Methanolinea sp.]
MKSQVSIDPLPSLKEPSIQQSFAVLHGSVTPDGSFFFWGEHPVGPVAKRRGRRPALPKISPHPFALPAASLKKILEGFLSSGQVPAIEETLTIWLPTAGRVPEPSPEVRARTGLLREKRMAVLHAWRVPVLKIPVSSVIPFLLSRDSGTGECLRGATLHAWGVVALFACEIVARGRFAPSIRTAEKNMLTGVWYPRLPDDDTLRLNELKSAMPPLVWAHLDGENRGAIASDPVRIFLDEAVNGLVTAAMSDSHLCHDQERRGDLLVEECFYRSLLGKDCVFSRETPAVTGLFSWLAGPKIAQTGMRCHTCFTVQEPEDGEDAWHVGFFLQSKDDPTLLVPASEVWSGRSNTVEHLVKKETGHPQDRMLYDLGTAARVYPPIREALKEARPDGIALPPEQVYGFLAETAPLLKELGCPVLLPSWWQHGRQHPSIRVTFKGRAAKKGKGSGAFSLHSILSFDWRIAIGDEELSPEEFDQLTTRKLPLMKVRGRWVVFDPEEVRRVVSAFKKVYPDKKMSLADALALTLGGPADEDLPLTSSVTDTDLRAFLDRLVSVQDPTPVVLPETFTGTLRPYQEYGTAWLLRLTRSGMGACLCDDMGLGKTVQVIAYLALRNTEGHAENPTLLVCPMSIIGNWMREVKRFAPSLRVYVHHGADRCSGDQFDRERGQSDLVITSYQTVQRDEELLSSHSWDCVVLDEAQNIKNHATKQARAVRKLPAGSRIAITGTPVENRLAELWSIMDFLNPGYLGTAAAFQKKIATPIERQHDATRALALKKIVRPFLLRRVKTDRKIISDLPEKILVKEFCPLTREQVSLYEAAVQDMLEKLDSLRGVARRGAVLVTLMRLKQICNHPALFLNDGSSLAARSGKLERLCEVLDEVLANNERALIFTQFASFGGILKPYLETVFSTEVLFLHGKTRREDRDRMVARFAEKQGPKVFILSLKAGGTGLNLTSATHVFHIDRWWNPAVEDQATDRAFRIGQSRNVEVHLMIAGGTLEEKIDAVLHEKRALAGSVIGTGEDWITGLSTEDLRELFSLRKSATGSMVI